MWQCYIHVRCNLLAYPPIMVKANKPADDKTQSAVKIPAPARSAVVMGFSTDPEDLWLSPALGLLVLFPPVVEVTGPVLLKAIRLATKIFAAIISSSIPVHPSNLDSYHVRPQVLLSLPEQDLAAACAEVLRMGRILL